MVDLLKTGPPSSPRLLLAHGAGAPMDSPFMNAMAERLAAGGVEVIRFEFDYMAKRRADGKRRGPDRMPKLIDRFKEALELVGPPDAVVIGGKSMGGRIGSIIADEACAAGLLCLGYPFHPSGKPERLRTAHLETLRTPTLIIQGTRDPLGSRKEVAGYSLSSAIDLAWIDDGDHSFKPRKRSGRTLDENLDSAATAVVGFIQGLG